MRGRVRIGVMLACAALLMPVAVQAQVTSEYIDSLQGIIDTLRTEMLKDDLLKRMMGIGQGIGGFAALTYIATRVWRHIANAEPIDFYPLFRPFVLGFAVMNFSFVLAITDGILSPTVSVTGEMVKQSDHAVKALLAQKERMMKDTRQWRMYVGSNDKGDQDNWLKYTHGIPENGSLPSSGIFDNMVGNDVKFALAKSSYNFQNKVKEWMSEILQIIYYAAALCLNTLRTFQLIVLGLLGPVVFGLAVFDGLQNSLSAWFSRYINIFLWLPVCNLFGAIIGKIQEKMLKIDLTQIGQQGDTFFSPIDVAYLVFLLIGIVGYFTVPTVAGYIVNAGGGGGMLSKVTSIVSSASSKVGAMGMATAQRTGSGAYNILNSGRYMDEGKAGTHTGEGATGAIGRKMGSFMASRLGGNQEKSEK